MLVITLDAAKWGCFVKWGRDTPSEGGGKEKDMVSVWKPQKARRPGENHWSSKNPVFDGQIPQQAAIIAVDEF